MEAWRVLAATGVRPVGMTGEKGTALISGDSGGVGGAAVTALPPLSAGLGLGMSTGPPDFFFFFFPI